MEQTIGQNYSDENYALDEVDMACEEIRVHMKYFVRYYVPTIIVVGLIGNFLSALTFMATKLRNLPSSHYLAGLAFADSGMLLCQVILMSGGDYSVPGMCQFTFYMAGVFSSLSVWYVVSFTLERFIVVRYPLRRLKWCTVRRARMVVISVAVFACVFNSHLFIFVRSTYDAHQNKTMCDVRDGFQEAANIMNHMDTALTFVLPMILIVIWNTAIAATTLCSKIRRESIAASRKNTVSSMTNYRGTLDEGMAAAVLLPAASGETFLGGESRRHVSRRLADDRKITRMLLIVSLVFLIMNFPDHVIRMTLYALLGNGMWVRMSAKSQCWILLAQMFSTILFNTNFAVNFFLYSLVGANFREHLKKMIIRILTCTCEKLDHVSPSACKLSRYFPRLFACLAANGGERWRFPSTASNGYGAVMPMKRSLERMSSAPMSPHTLRNGGWSPSPSPGRSQNRRMTAATVSSWKSTHSNSVQDSEAEQKELCPKSPVLSKRSFLDPLTES